MHFQLIIRILGFLLIFLGAAQLIPLPFAYYYNDGDFYPILSSAGISLAFGSIAFLGFPKKKKEMRPKEGFAVVTFGWIILSIFGSLPYILSGAIPDFTNAFFETMSGFTTTGASILTNVEALPHGIMFWRSLTNWIGGMGIIVLTIAILPFLGVGGMQLFKAEVPGPTADKLSPRVTETAKILWGVYLIFTAVLFALLMLGGLDGFTAINHALATMATGGFSTSNSSVGSIESSFVHYVIIVFMLIAGINFSLHYRMLKGNFREVTQNNELKFFISIILIATVAISIDVYSSTFDIFTSVRDALFQVTSIITTTGFGTADYEQWSSSSKVILYMLMFIGGMAGSTSGGMKVIRIFLLVKFVRGEVVKLLHPKAVVAIKVGNSNIDRQTMTNVLGYLTLFVFVVVFGIILLSFMGLDFETAFGAIAATINNIGPGLGAVGPTDNYALMPDAAKWLLSFFMLFGRLELFTVIILFAPSYWRK